MKYRGEGVGTADGGSGCVVMIGLKKELKELRFDRDSGRVLMYRLKKELKEWTYVWTEGRVERMSRIKACDDYFIVDSINEAGDRTFNVHARLCTH